MKFKYDFNFQRYSGLYCRLYAVVAQSEYIRLFLSHVDGKNPSFEEAPFCEISPTKRRTATLRYENNKTTTEIKEDILNTDISDFNKKLLADLIIAKGELASQELLKLAVSYRFANRHYSGSDTKVQYEEKLQKVADEEEIKLIKQMIRCIVKEYNSLRQALKLSFDEQELASGVPHC